MKTINRYFPYLTEHQINQLEQLGELLKFHNKNVNIISRKDIDNVYKHHILHSLSILKWFDFKSATSILDLGTGGGLPGLPLAILKPDCLFHLIDARRKKIEVVIQIKETLNLKNVKVSHSRAEELNNKYQFVVSRAVTNLTDLWELSKRLINEKNQQNGYPNGLICLKGGNINEEIKKLTPGTFSEFFKITDQIKEIYYEDKYIVYIQK